MDDHSDREACRAGFRVADDVCRMLGLMEGSRRQPCGRWVRCPAHAERDASCSITEHADGIGVHCFSCKWGGDCFDLIAACAGLDRAREFNAVVRRGLELLGLSVADLATAPAMVRPPPAPKEQKPPPPADEVAKLWSSCRSVTRDDEVAAWLTSRGLNPAEVARLDLCRALPLDVPLPRWAWYRGDAATGASWAALGWRAIVPMFNAAGEVASVRARYVLPGVPPHGGGKALPPTGYGAVGLAMLCPLGQLVFRLGAWPWWAAPHFVITEGEPDHLHWSTKPRKRPFATLGIGGTGQWNASLAAAIPDGSTVIIWTDRDDAGDRYAEQLAADLGDRVTCVETEPAERAERRRTFPERQAAKAHENRERARQGAHRGRVGAQVGMPGVR